MTRAIERRAYVPFVKIGIKDLHVYERLREPRFAVDIVNFVVENPRTARSSRDRQWFFVDRPMPCLKVIDINICNRRKEQ